MFKQGDKIKITTDSESFEGVFVNEEKDFLVLKLPSGYNVGIAKRNIKDKKIFDKKSDGKSDEPDVKSKDQKREDEKGNEKGKLKNNPKLPTITLLHTGGTIASKVDYSTGAVIAQFEPEDIIKLFPELKDIANVESKLIRNIQSEMIRFAHFNLLAKAVKHEAEKGVDGIIITHGTDLLHVTSTALAFALENIGIPVILVGSQRSSDRPSSDSAMNLLAGVEFIAKTKFSGVAICMHENESDESCLILPACKTRKMHTSRRDAFRPINSKPIATINYEKKKIDFLSSYEQKDKEKKIELKLFDEDLKVGLFKTHAQTFASELLAFKDFDGLVIELLGIGHMPTMHVDEFTKENKRILDAVAELAKNMPVVAAPQTLYGRVNMNVYTPGKQLLEAGVIGNYTDMIPEIAHVKLAWLLSNYKKEEIKGLFETNLRGEISDRSEKEYFLN